MSGNWFSRYSNLLLLNYKTVSPFFSKCLWVMTFRDTYVLKHKTRFCTPFWTDCLIPPEEKIKTRKWDMVLYIKERQKKWRQNDGFPIFLCTFSLVRVGWFYWKSILRKTDFKFLSTENLFCLYKTMGRDYVIKIYFSIFSLTIHIMD